MSKTVIFANSSDVTPGSQTSTIDVNSTLSGEEENEEEEVEVYEVVEITEELLKEIANELGLITLCWPKDAVTDIEQRKFYPPSFRQNSTKEKLLLWYAENFRRQYYFTYKDRKPLFLAADNECGIQKMVCTTIRPTSLGYPEMSSWQGCARFVSDHLDYEKLPKPTNLPDQMVSPTAVLMRQRAHSFEFSTVLVSYLISAGYSAYVVSGYATREYCNNDQARVVCPLLVKKKKVEEEIIEKPPSKYQAKQPPSLQSKFVLEMERREKQKIEDDAREEEEKREREIAEFEKPPPDEFYGMRLHSWVVILPGNKEISNVFFIEPSTGNSYDIDHSQYLGIESIWDHTNYWVNLQSCAEGCKNLQFDLTDNTCWLHLLAGEPWHVRKELGQADDDPYQVLQEKHLDIPTSWVLRLDVSLPVFIARYPKGHKTVYYKKAKEHFFGPYLQTDGLERRVLSYEEYDWTDCKAIREFYSNRVDCMLEQFHDLKANSICQKFKRGRKDALKEHFYYFGMMAVEDEHVMEFYHEARVDGLEKVELNPLFLKQHFQNRDDLLYYRSVVFKGPDSASSKRSVQKFTEKFLRNPNKKPNEDIAQQIFDIFNNEVKIEYHIKPDKLTGAVREYTKPPLSERGEHLTFNPALTRGHQFDINAPPLKQLHLFYLLDEMLKIEEKSLFHIREMEKEISQILRAREFEIHSPKLFVSKFDRLRNQDAKTGMKERELQILQKSVREVEDDADYLAPYLARLGFPQNLTKQQAINIREQCLTDYKQSFVDRASHLQSLFEKESQLMQQKFRWYETERDNISKEDEEQYLEFIKNSHFYLHTLEIRLNRLQEVATQRYLEMETYLRGDQRLGVMHSKH